MFNWFVNRRREKLTGAPFPPAWQDILHRNVGHYCYLNDNERRHLRELIQVFIAEQTGKEPGGLELTNKAEFFAVATEHFFDQPLSMIKHAPDLYRVLKAYYRQDTAGRVARYE